MSNYEGAVFKPGITITGDATSFIFDGATLDHTTFVANLYTVSGGVGSSPVSMRNVSARSTAFGIQFADTTVFDGADLTGATFTGVRLLTSSFLDVTVDGTDLRLRHERQLHHPVRFLDELQTVREPAQFRRRRPRRRIVHHLRGPAVYHLQGLGSRRRLFRGCPVLRSVSTVDAVPGEPSAVVGGERTHRRRQAAFRPASRAGRPVRCAGGGHARRLRRVERARHEGADLPGVRLPGARGARARAAGEVDRRALGLVHVRPPRPRPRDHGRAGARRRRASF